MTCQARPQSGECFGEFPPRHLQDETSQYPMIIPSPVAAYNSVYSEEYIAKKAADMGGLKLSNELSDEAVLLLSSIENDEWATTLEQFLFDLQCLHYHY